MTVSQAEIVTIFKTVNLVMDLLNFELLDSVRASKGSFGFEVLTVLGDIVDGAYDILGLTSRLSSNPYYWSDTNGYFNLFEGTTFETLGEAVDALDSTFFEDFSDVFDQFDVRLIDTLAEVFDPVDLGFLNGLIDVLNRLDLKDLERGDYNNDLLDDLAAIIKNIDDLESLSEYINDRSAQGSTIDDRLVGSVQIDLLLGLSGDDTLLGRGSQDLLNGGSGSDVLRGMSGADVLVGDREGDWLQGGAGADTLLGGAGADWHWGGAGGDVFVFETGQSLDIVKDFVVGKDILQINVQDLHYDEVSFVNRSGGAVLRLGSKRLALIEGVDAATLSSEDVIVKPPFAYG